MRLMIIIGFIVLMLAIMLGRNPIKEAQEAEIARRLKYGADPLTRETNMFIEKKEQEKPISKTIKTKVAQPDGTLPETADRVMVDSLENDKKLPDRSNNNNDYYPPLVDNIDGIKKNAQKNTKAEIENTAMKLRSGQKLISEGTQVFTIDATGEKVVLPDGKYVLYDGNSIEISGGVRVVRTSPFE